MTPKELSEDDKKIFHAIDKNDVILLRAALVDKRNVNILNENLITPLQHASYRGNKEMVQILLDQGADPNLCEHAYGYTALHFAGLSGNVDVCNLLLLAGAKSSVVNTLGRTAAQMAAFVGNHNCVTTINNYVQKKDVEYYTILQGQQTKPYLQPFLSESFHKFIMTINVHPVRIALNLQSIVGLIEHLDEISNVLELMCRKEMKGKEMNEVMSLKFHYLGYIVEAISKIRKNKKDDDDKKSDVFELFTRKLLKPNKDGNLDFMDNFLKECIREFPFRECTLFKQMVASLTGNDPPPALTVITAAINGQRGFMDHISVCNTCGEEKPGKKCSKCKVVQYCDRNCQRLHWFVHKKACTRLSQCTSEQSEPQETKVDPSDLNAEIENLLVSN
ncbi:ankyrin repeat and mynd domain-containing protein 2 [Holotrichia oblita]|uniref:Ankyrin repeat and mynd domain-containing protein 2 n=1 Tax=Holotrichia oblita TaxID=644536 RepID=A0ACB9T614_HOLOL|nr:ankyrin repeat and mynd domain-containing protein 2 [Holotrichia oblita]